MNNFNTILKKTPSSFYTYYRERVSIDSGEIINDAELRKTIQFSSTENLYKNLVLHIDADAGFKLRVDGNDNYIEKAYNLYFIKPINLILPTTGWTDSGLTSEPNCYLFLHPDYAEDNNIPVGDINFSSDGTYEKVERKSNYDSIYVHIQESILDEHSSSSPGYSDAADFMAYLSEYPITLSDKYYPKGNDAVQTTTSNQPKLLSDSKDFDGTSYYLNCGNDLSLGPCNGSFTWLMWVNVDSTESPVDPAWDLFVAKRNGNKDGYYIGCNKTEGTVDQGGLNFLLADDVDRIQTLEDDYLLISLNTWVFVIAVLDRENNIQKMSTNTSGNWVSVIPPQNYIGTLKDLSIGFDLNFGRWHLLGQLNDIRFYNKALSDTEISAIYENTKSKYE